MVLPSHEAAKAGNVKRLKKVVSQNNVNNRDLYSQTCLHLAAFCGHIEAVKKLLDLGADVNAVDKNGFTPLLSAASASERSEIHLQICELLLKKGMNSGHFWLECADGRVLWQLVTSICVSCLKKSLGSNPMLVTTDSTSVVHYLARFPYSRKLQHVLQQAIDGGANINLQEAAGDTPLHQAAFRGSPETVKLLVQMGAKIDQTNS